MGEASKSFEGGKVERSRPDKSGSLIRYAWRHPRKFLMGERPGTAKPTSWSAATAPQPADTTLKIKITRGPERCIVTPGLFDDFELRHGDRLTIVPADRATNLIRTPEGNLHVRAAAGFGVRVPSEVTFTPYRGYAMPDHLARLTGAGPETFDALGKAHIVSYDKFMGLRPDMTFLEIGCGMGRDAFALFDVIGLNGRYHGIDVQRESIVWLQKNISRDRPNFQFHHFDAYHELHNPLGTKATMDFSLPAPDRSVDRIALGSVFTHIFEEEVLHYMKEIARVLKPDGLCYATFFLYTPEVVEASRRNHLTPYNLRFEHAYADGCFVDNAQYPTGGVAYTPEAMKRMIDGSGLTLARPYLKGKWSGYYPDNETDDGQDVAILKVH